MRVTATTQPAPPPEKTYTLVLTAAEALALRYAESFYGQVQDSAHPRSQAGSDVLRKLDLALESAGCVYHFGASE